MPSSNDSKLEGIMDVICDTLDSVPKEADGVRINGKTAKKLKDELDKTDYVGMAYGFSLKDERPLGTLSGATDDGADIFGYFWNTPVRIDESLDDGAVEVDFPKDKDVKTPAP